MHLKLTFLLIKLMNLSIKSLNLKMIKMIIMIIYIKLYNKYKLLVINKMNY